MKRALAVLMVTAVVTAGCSSAGRPGVDVGAPVVAPVAEPSAPAPVGGEAATPARKPAVLHPVVVYEQGEARWGFIAPSGKMVVAPQYELAGEFGSDGLAPVWQERKIGLINQQGQLVLAPAFNWLTDPVGGMRIGYTDKERAVIDETGAVLFTSAELTGTFGSGLVPFARGGFYGYLDTRGAEAIKPQFKWAGDFAGGQALVQVQEGLWAVIDPTGRQLLSLPYQQARELGEGMVVVQAKDSRKSIYASVAGASNIPIAFMEADRFEDGRAVVKVGDSWENQAAGLIDKQGQFVIPAEFAYVEPLGGGLYAVARKTKEYVPGHFAPKAIWNRDGKQLTDYLYYQVGKVSEGLLSVSDETATYFLDTTGAKAKGLPALPGQGSLAVQGDLIQARVDNLLSYINRSGQTVWQEDRTVALAGGARVENRKNRPDRLTLVHYPVVTGLKDLKVAEAINGQLQREFAAGGSAASDVRMDTQVSWTAEQVGQVLVVHRTGSQYPLGAAHGMPMSVYSHFDLTTGQRYGLADLFKAGSPYLERLQGMVAAQIAARGKDHFNHDHPAVTLAQPFAARADGL
ncbi:MAG TPA: WG repeat-containing protein, partial [Symbiobacteriaceae bacterium]|nr:WG repeat-containing protein [Symbiobacteriaceae bacterium]